MPPSLMGTPCTTCMREKASPCRGSAHLSVLVKSVPGVGVLDVGVSLEELVVHHALDGDLEWVKMASEVDPLKCAGR